MKISYYTQSGSKKKEKLTIPQEIFGVEFNPTLVHQVVTIQAANLRRPYAHTKGRSEVSGGGRKPWPQKGTGRARHGSIRSPLWRGGGVTFGPTKKRVFKKRIPKKMRRKALFMVLSQKLADQELIFLEKLYFPEPKTKLAARFLDNFFKRLKKDFQLKKTSVLIIRDEKDSILQRTFRNIPKIKVVPVNSLSALKLLQPRFILCPVASLQKILTLFGHSS